MNTTKILTRLLVGLSVMVLMSGCKNPFVDQITLDNDSVVFDYNTTFSKRISIDLDKNFDLGNNGSIHFFTDAMDHLNINIHASYELFAMAGTEVNTLPNGTAFPTIVSFPLKEKLVKDEAGKYRLFLYVGSDAGKTKRLVGTALELGKLDNTVPEVSLTQNFNKDGATYATFSIYGPKDVSGVSVPGGIFIIGDVNKVISVKPTGSIEWQISGKDADQFQTKEAKTLLFQKFQRALEAEGIHLK